ncbi:MAG: NfeD family protein [Betaproteobacteria bacterium]|nr:MAG: NfeD family protein [Betaproteobacteria bacterium]
MSTYLMWWIAAAALVAAELLTGTLYLLVIGLALACAGIAALSGAGATLQWLTAGVLGIAGMMLLQRWKRRLSAATPAQPNLDIGQMVRVQSWGPGGTARVAYRGSTWDAELASASTPRTETMYIVGTRGSVLILSDRRPGEPQVASESL